MLYISIYTEPRAGDAYQVLAKHIKGPGLDPQYSKNSKMNKPCATESSPHQQSWPKS